MFFLPIIIFGVFFIVFLIIGLSAFKSHKHVGDTMQDMINTVSAYAEKEFNNAIEQLDNKPHEKQKTCEYCGSAISAGSSKCDSCGAKVKK